MVYFLACHGLTKAVYISSMTLCQEVSATCSKPKPYKNFRRCLCQFSNRAEKLVSNSGSEKYPVDLKNNSANPKYTNTELLRKLPNVHNKFAVYMFGCCNRRHVEAQLPLSFYCTSTQGCLFLLITRYHWSVL